MRNKRATPVGNTKAKQGHLVQKLLFGDLYTTQETRNIKDKNNTEHTQNNYS